MKIHKNGSGIEITGLTSEQAELVHFAICDYAQKVPRSERGKVGEDRKFFNELHQQLLKVL